MAVSGAGFKIDKTPPELRLYAALEGLLTALSQCLYDRNTRDFASAQLVAVEVRNCQFNIRPMRARLFASFGSSKGKQNVQERTICARYVGLIVMVWKIETVSPRTNWF
jgi:hypothetical protein